MTDLTIYERALDYVPDGAVIGLGSGRAAWAFVDRLGARIRTGKLNVRGVPTSDETARIATQHGVPLVSLADAPELALTVDGADEVDPALNLIKGYGRALVREKIVAASSKQLIVLVGTEKLVPRLGTRGRLPVEVVPFAVALCERKLASLGARPALWQIDGKPAMTDNGNHILDCQIEPIADARQFETDIRAIPGVVGTGLFIDMAEIVLVGEGSDFRLIKEMKRNEKASGAAKARRA